VVEIGANCWIGAAAIVMADVGAGSTIGAGSVVTRAIPAGSVAVGSPARVLPRA
jgi:acetyltransferase-like isoleucine patch superfamily enzyme